MIILHILCSFNCIYSYCTWLDYTVVNLSVIIPEISITESNHSLILSMLLRTLECQMIRTFATLIANSDYDLVTFFSI